MTHSSPAPLRTWLTEPLSRDVRKSVERLRRVDDVRYVALMPDVHLAKDVCIGAVVATERLIYPAAVGGDIGCGMAALAFNADASLIDDECSAANMLAGLYKNVPANKHPKPREMPRSLQRQPLSETRLDRLAARAGRVQLGTLGRGNHFLEFQADQDGRLWMMVHSGSRVMGQAITESYLKKASGSASGLRWLDSTTNQGQAYLADASWALTYARENRLAMLVAVEDLLRRRFGVAADWESLIHCDHNYVECESFFGRSWWVHRKGAQSASADELGIIPGSMGTASFHTAGRGCEHALRSSAHGAGRRLSRSEARKAVSGAAFNRQVGRLWYDHRRTFKLRDEAPSAYKDVRAVMRAQRDLAKIVRELRPVLSYKGV